MPERKKTLDHDRDEIIAAFDREQAETHELDRQHREMITNARRKDRLVRPGDHEQHH